MQILGGIVIDYNGEHFPSNNLETLTCILVGPVNVNVVRFMQKHDKLCRKDLIKHIIEMGVEIDKKKYEFLKEKYEIHVEPEELGLCGLKPSLNTEDSPITANILENAAHEGSESNNQAKPDTHSETGEDNSDTDSKRNGSSSFGEQRKFEAFFDDIFSTNDTPGEKISIIYVNLNSFVIPITSR